MTVKYPTWINKIEGAAQTPEEMNGIVEVLQNHAENLSLHDIRILAASSGIYTDSLTPTSEVPAEVGNKVFLVTIPGTYTNFGNVVLPENNFGFIFKNGSSFSLQSVEMPMQDLNPLIIQQKALSGLDIMPFINLTNGHYTSGIDGNTGDAEGYSITDFIDISSFNVLEINAELYQNFAYYSEANIESYVCGGTICTNFLRKPKTAKYARFTVKDGENFTLKLHNESNIALLDKRFTRNGFVIIASTGVSEALTFYSHTDFIPVKAGDVVRYKIHNAIFAGPKHLAFFNSKRKYINGTSAGFEFTATEDGYFTLSLESELLVFTTLTINDLDLSLKVKRNVFVSSTDASADFKTVLEAIEIGKIVGTKESPYNITFEGTHIGHHDIAPYFINLYGISPDKSIITEDSGDYTKVPVNASGRNSGANFTAKATNSKGATPSILAYGIHLDHSGAGKSTWFNCKFISDVNSGVGLGTQNDQQFEFVECQIENNSNYNAGGLYLHNSPYVNHKNMSVLIKDCVVKSKLSVSCRIDDSNTNAGHNDDDGTVFTFINNMFWSETAGKDASSIQFTNAPTTGDVGQIKIGLQSYGNNISKLNK